MAINNVGDYQRFNYTGGMQSFEITKKALYKLEVWGGKGGDGHLHNTWPNQRYDAGGNGGYSVGYKVLDAGQIIYICVGGQGQRGSGSYSGAAGGYNGGGSSAAKWIDTHEISNGAGGGATHMALVSGTLANIGYADFVTNGKGLIVAGGGGGGLTTEPAEARDGGAGGGLSGSNGQLNDHPGSDPTDGKGGTQTTGYAFGLGESTPSGYGTENKTPGGGGFYGGYGGCQSAIGDRLEVSGSGGGSGWIDGVPAITLKGQTYMPGSSNGINAGDGYAIITYIADVFPPITFDSVLISALTKDGHNIDSVSYNGTIIS